jgi:hypothetical protein
VHLQLLAAAPPRALGQPVLPPPPHGTRWRCGAAAAAAGTAPAPGSSSTKVTLFERSQCFVYLSAVMLTQSRHKQLPAQCQRGTHVAHSPCTVTTPCHLITHPHNTYTAVPAGPHPSPAPSTAHAALPPPAPAPPPAAPAPGTRQQRRAPGAAGSSSSTPAVCCMERCMLCLVMYGCMVVMTLHVWPGLQGHNTVQRRAGAVRSPAPCCVGHMCPMMQASCILVSWAA